MALTLTATVEPDYHPPRVRLDVTASAGETSVTIIRLDPDGRYRNVRTSDDGPLPISGGVATVFDYEAPFGLPVTYLTDVVGGPEASATLESPVPWLIHVGVPSRSQPVEFRVGTNDEEVWDIDRGVFIPLEREFPIVVTGGPRVAPSSSLIVSTETLAELAAMWGLLADGTVLLLNVPPSLELGLATAYIAIGRVTPRRLSSVGTDPARDLDMPYQVVDRPAGGTQAAITWDDIAEVGADDYTADALPSQYDTWEAIVDAGVTSWADLAAPTA